MPPALGHRLPYPALKRWANLRRPLREAESLNPIASTGRLAGWVKKPTSAKGAEMWGTSKRANEVRNSERRGDHGGPLSICKRQSANSTCIPEMFD